MTVYLRTLRDRRRSLVWWCVGITALVLLTVAFFPTIEGNRDFERVAEDLPPAVRTMFGFDDSVPVTSAPGYLHARLFSVMLPLLLLVFAIAGGARMIGGSEESGVLELLLANPVTRSSIVASRYAALVTSVAALTCVSFAAIVVFGWPLGAVAEISFAGLAGACAGAGLIALLHGTIAFTVGAATGKRDLAVAVAAAVAGAGYLLHGLSTATDALEAATFLVPWHWYLGTNMLVEGPALEAVLAPLAVTAALVVPAPLLFEGRDLR